MEEINQEIKTCLGVLQRGGLILYPTDTVWGIGCDATNEIAVSKIFKLKKRELSTSVLVLLDHEGKLLSYVKEVPEAAWDLIEFSQKPLTIVYDSAKNLAKNVIAKDGTVGIRITRDEFCKRLIEKFRKPIVSTSANISGVPVPANFDSIDPEIISGVDYVVNLRQHEKANATPSTIIRLKVNGEFKMIRK